MSHSSALIYLHTEPDDVTVFHLDRLRAWNPDIVIYPVAMSDTPVEGGFSLMDTDTLDHAWQKATKDGTNPEKVGRNYDLAVIQWYLHWKKNIHPKNSTFDRWFVVDNKLRCNIELHTAFYNVLPRAFATPLISDKIPTLIRAALPRMLRKNAMSIDSLGCFMIDQFVLNEVISNYYLISCQIPARYRLGALIAEIAGMSACHKLDSKVFNFNLTDTEGDVEGPGLWYPVTDYEGEIPTCKEKSKTEGRTLAAIQDQKAML